jgi:glucosamine--fructose-6-phosphate aminotransferase (isomerizing)
MCGIVGYIGSRDAWPVVLNGLKRLEYRGYDSAGIAIINNVGFNVYKKTGKVACLEAHTADKDKSGHIAIGHTRWATHGVPSDANSHPHSSNDNRLHIIHNGIIENYLILKEELLARGHTFKSETDTEILIHLIEEIQNIEQTDLLEAVRLALNTVIGAYAIVILDREKSRPVNCRPKRQPPGYRCWPGRIFYCIRRYPYC